MNEIMSEENEAQESGNRVEGSRTHRLDIEDMTGLGKKGFNGGTLVVEVKQG